MKILVTGGAGYIGSHTCLELIKGGHKIIILDNLSNSSIDSIQNVSNYCDLKIPFYEGDIADSELIDKIFEDQKIDACIHFAAYKSVIESMQFPEKYFENNVEGTKSLISSLDRNGCKKIIFSSTAAVYGDPQIFPITEEYEASNGKSPYAETKYQVECMLKEVVKNDPTWKVIILRYFNPLGAHPSGIIGEKLDNNPDNLMPIITKAAIGDLETLKIFGNDYDTVDGTGVRDFIHVVDLARGHIAALKSIDSMNGAEVFNLGTGQGYSVLETVNTFMSVNSVDVPYEVCARREGDIAVSYCSPKKAEEVLGWKATHKLEDMCRDAWRWQVNWKKKMPVLLEIFLIFQYHQLNMNVSIELLTNSV